MQKITYELQSQLLIEKRNYVIEKTKQTIKDLTDKETIALIIQSNYQKYLIENEAILTQPYLVARGQLPFKEDFEAFMEEVTMDIALLKKEHQRSGQFVLDTYNYMHSEKKRLVHQIQDLNSLVGDLNLLANEQDAKTIYFKESFENPRAQDALSQLENIASAQVASKEGVLTLARKKSENLSLQANVVSIQGNGEAGTNHLARRVQILNENEQLVDKYVFLNDNPSLRNDRVEALLDGRSDSIFEYQTVNVPNTFVNQYKRYDFEWVKGKKEGSPLQLKLVLELEKEQPLNWIHIHPYYPVNSKERVLVYSIRTSKDGFEYEGLFEQKEFVLNQELNETPNSYLVEDLFDTSNELKDANFAGQGVWSFPSRSTRFVEIVFEQKESYQETIGQEVYFVRTKDQNIWIQVPKVEELAYEPAGEYSRSLNGESVVYKKEIVGTPDGWRYAIALRDINLLSYRYEEKSSFVSKRYTLDGEIGKVMLYANEKIPTSYLDVIETTNDWITYEVSFDDINWYPISPMHHEPTKDTFPPKILELNGREIDLASTFQVHKAIIQTKETPTQVRFRVTMTRPVGEAFEATTPLLEDVAIRVERKEVNE